VPWTLRHQSPAYLTHDRYWTLSRQERAAREAKLLGDRTLSGGAACVAVLYLIATVAAPLIAFLQAHLV
jgi:hypothetical protein